MTISSTNTKNSYSGDGTTVAFSYTFKILDDDDIQVILRTNATGTETVQTKTTHYTVSGVGNAGGGTITFGSAPAATETVVLLRNVPLTQTTDYTPNDPFPAATHEDALDKLTLMAQDTQEEVDRSIKLSRTNTMTSTEFTVGATTRANKIFAFDSSGELAVTQEIGTFQGDWAASTAYAERDLVKDTSTNNIFIVNSAHTSSGSQPLTTNANASKYDLIVDAASATTSATNAASSATAAATSATAAANSATAAATSESNAAASEAGVAANATAAAASAASASTSETNASTSETNASNSASAAATSATNAATSATSASNSASAAGTSETNAATSATTATTKAAEASTSASNAATSETNAATSASNASTSASSASTSASAAAASAASAAASFDAFDDIYLGAKASAPTQDNDGDALTNGDLYFDTGDNELYIWNGSAWQAASPNIVADTTPQLGGDLDLNSNDITGTGNIDVTGTVTADGLTVDGDTVLDVTRSNTAGQGFLTIQQDGSTTHKWEHRFTTDRDYRIDHYNGSSWNTRLSLEDNGDISFYDNTGTSQGFYWDASTQRLGLGTTGPSTTLQVGDGSADTRSTFNPSSAFAIGVKNGANHGGFIGSNGSSGMQFSSSGGANRMVIDSSGNVGINNASPSQLLSVGGDSSGTKVIQVTNSVAGTAFNDGMQMFINDSAGGLNMRENYPLQIYVNGSERMRITSGGDVLVSKTAAGTGTVGVEARSDGLLAATRDGNQPLLLNRKTSDGNIALFQKDGSTVGSIGVLSSRIYIGDSDTGLFIDDSNNAISPYSVTASNTVDNTIDLGVSGKRWKDLYLSGGAYIGGTAAANKLDDYEEGTFTPSFTSTGASFSYGVQGGNYTKVGRLVMCSFRVSLSAAPTGTTSNVVYLSGLPFSSATLSQTYHGGSIGHYFNFNLSATGVLAYQTVSGTSTTELKVVGDNLGETAVLASHLNSGAEIRGQVIYHAS